MIGETVPEFAGYRIYRRFKHLTTVKPGTAEMHDEIIARVIGDVGCTAVEKTEIEEPNGSAFHVETNRVVVAYAIRVLAQNVIEPLPSSSIDYRMTNFFVCDVMTAGQHFNATILLRGIDEGNAKGEGVQGQGPFSCFVAFNEDNTCILI